MPGALFNRITNWYRGQDFTFASINAEFNNILSNFRLSMMDDHSLTVPQMQETLNPGAVGSEVQATSAAEEIKQLRFMLKSITGEALWYSPPAATISDLQSFLNLPDNQLLSGLVNGDGQPSFLVANGAAASVQLQGAATNLVAFINASRRTFIANTTASGLSLAPAANNTTLVNLNSLANTQEYGKTLGEGDTTIPIDAVGSEITALNGRFAAFKIVNGGNTEYFVAEIDTTNGVLKNAFRGFFFDSTSAHVPRIKIADNDTITLLKLSWVFATYNASTEGIEITYNQPVVSADQPSSPSPGDFWFDLVNASWKKYTGGSFQIQAAIWIGYCAQDSANCIASRSADFYHEYSDLNEIEIDRTAVNTVRSRWRGARVSVYGTVFRLDPDNGTWTMGTDLDSGVSEAADTTFYCYVTHLGDRILSNVMPHRRQQDLRGAYHPGKPWRCVGQIQNDASQDFVSTSSFGERVLVPAYGQVLNGSLRAKADTNILVITLQAADGSDPSPLNPVLATFRLGSGATGLWTVKRITSPLQLTIASTSTLGLPAGTDQTPWIHVGLAIVANEVKLFASGGIPAITGHSLVSVFQMAAAANTRYNPYAHVAGTTTNCPFVLIGKIKAPQAVAGTWATNPAKIIYDLAPKPPTLPVGVSGNGAANYGSGSTKIRRFATADFTQADSHGDNWVKFLTTAALGTECTILEDGLYFIEYLDSATATNDSIGISVNSAQLTTNFASSTVANWATLYHSTSTNLALTINNAIWLVAGDILRAHSNGSSDNPACRFGIKRLSGIRPY